VSSRRLLAIIGLVLVTVPLQTAVLGRFSILGAKPELLTLLVVSIAMIDGAVSGTLAGFAAGLLLDAQTSLPDGLGALVLAATGAAIGRLRPLLIRPSAWVPAAVVFAATLASLTTYSLMALLLGAPTGSLVRSVMRIVIAAIYTAVLTPLIYPWLAKMLIERPRQVIGSVVRR
jgi:rod shape-determining protein MreD